MLRAALIAALALATPASADLWTAPPASSAPVERPTPPSPTGPFTLTVVVDPACPVSAAVTRDALVFARAHADVVVQILLTTRPARSREAMRPYLAAAEAGVRVAWVPGAVGRLAPAALPAVYLEDGRGHGARATGRPPLETLWRAVRGVVP
jgi:hypothetical protein